MKCADCRKPLDSISYEDVLIDQCGNCGGLFLDESRLELIEISRQQFIDKHKRYSKSKSQERYRRCPKCDVAMKLSKYGKFVERTLDKCPDCDGIWLDKGEIEDVQAAYEMYEENIRKNRGGG